MTSVKELAETRVLMLPGLHNSGPEHWQSRWEANHPSFCRVNQQNWDTPDRKEWVATLQQEISSAESPVILVAHSLGCALATWWASLYSGPVRGALLVAPSDVEADDFPQGPTGFRPMPLLRLPFPSIVVASTNDLLISVERAKHFAKAWGSRIEVPGALGHINAQSSLGAWPEGFGLLREF